MNERIQEVLSVVKERWGVDPKTKGKTYNAARSRWSAAYVLRRGYNLKLKEIAEALNVTLPCVVHACRRAEQNSKIEGWWSWLEDLLMKAKSTQA